MLLVILAIKLYQGAEQIVITTGEFLHQGFAHLWNDGRRAVGVVEQLVLFRDFLNIGVTADYPVRVVARHLGLRPRIVAPHFAKQCINQPACGERRGIEQWCDECGRDGFHAGFRCRHGAILCCAFAPTSSLTRLMPRRCEFIRTLNGSTKRPTPTSMRA